MKKIPLRMCIVCKEMKPKKELIRIVKTAEGDIKLDTGRKTNGRGAYICNTDECMNKLVKTKALSRTFKENVSAEVYQGLIEEYERNKN